MEEVILNLFMPGVLFVFFLIIFEGVFAMLGMLREWLTDAWDG